MEENTPIKTKQQEEVTIKHLIAKISSYYKGIVKKWWLIMLCSILIGGLFFYWAYKDDPKYNAELTFMVYEDEGMKVGGGFSSMLGSLGIGSEKVNLEKIMELSKSNKILFQTLFDSVETNSKKDIIANKLIEMYDLNKEIKSEAPLKIVGNNINNLNEEQRSILNKIKTLLVGKSGILETSYGVKSGIMKISISTLDEKLSVDFLIKHFNNLRSFYINKSVAKETRTYSILEDKVSRLYSKMNNKDYEGAKYEDKTLGVWQLTDKVQSKIYERDSRISSLLYAEAVKNLEIAEFSLRTKTPFIQEIDIPFSPLEKIKKSEILYSGIGVILGAFIAIIAITILNYLKEMKFE